MFEPSLLAKTISLAILSLRKEMDLYDMFLEDQCCLFNCCGSFFGCCASVFQREKKKINSLIEALTELYRTGRSRVLDEKTALRSNPTKFLTILTKYKGKFEKTSVNDIVDETICALPGDPSVSTKYTTPQPPKMLDNLSSSTNIFGIASSH